MAKPWEEFQQPQQSQTVSSGGKPWEEFQAPKEQTWGETASSAVSSFLPSLGRVAGGVVESVTSPIETAKNLGKLVIGTGEALTGKAIEAINPELTAAPSERERLATNVGEFYKQRYGSAEGFKQALAQDPAGVMADAATLLTGGGAALSKAGISRVGELTSRAGAAIDPLALAAKTAVGGAKLAGKAAAPMLGMTTGAGAEAIKQAYRAGREGGQTAEAFQGNLRGNVPMQDVLETAKSDLATMNAAKTAEYRNNMRAIQADKSVLDFQNIDKALTDSAGQVMFGTQVKNTPAAEALTKISDEIGAWKNLDPAQYHTPEGLDALKQVVGGIVESIPYEQKTARMVGNNVYHAIKDEIAKQAPVYSKTMKDYADATEQIREIERALSLGQKAAADTSMRKLQSLMRNNVSTNYGQRLKLAQELEQKGGGQIMPQLAGQALGTLTPRGLQSATTIPAALMAGPGVLAAASPRLVGEAAYYTGKAAGGKNALAKYMAGRSNVNPRIAANLLYQAQQPK